MSELGPWERKEGADAWAKRGGLISQGAELSCTFCGSLNPDTFMTWVEAGREVGPTDKSYKVYIQGPNGQAKFYFMHLSRDQKQRFVDLYNDRTMNVGYPGDFYTSPFFMADAPKGATNAH